MKKIVNKLKQNAKIITAFVLGAILTGGTVYAATVLPSSQVGYNNSTSGLAATDVQGALDELNTKASTWINPLENYKMNKNKNIIASSSGIKLIRNGHVYEIKSNNFNVEKDHIQQVFSDVSCNVRSDSRVYCSASDFNCYVRSDGSVACTDLSDSTGCHVSPDLSTSCTESYIEKSIFGGIAVNGAKTMLATKEGITLTRRNGAIYHISTNNYNVEKDHIQQIFSDVSCTTYSDRVRCIASDAGCDVTTSGSVLCDGFSGVQDRGCYVYSDGQVTCM